MSKFTILVAAGALLLGLASAPAAFADDAMDAAMKACSTGDQSAQNKWQCEVHVLAMKKSADAAAAGTSTTIHVDFNDADDTDAHKAAKAALYQSLQTCDEDASSGGRITQCHMQAFDAYQQAIGG